MDLGPITFADALPLTKTKFETEFGKITGHQITSLDMAEAFNWGVDLPLGGFGILAARHINGYILDSRYFLDGNDSEAIQAAINFAAATSGASGIVMIPKLATPWSIDATISVPSNMTIVGNPSRTPVSLDVAAPMFQLVANAKDVTIANFDVDGNQNTASIVSLAGNASRVTVENIHVASATTSTTAYMDGYILSGSTNTCDLLRIKDCVLYGGGGFVSIDGGNFVEIVNNKFEDPAGGNTASPVCIDLDTCIEVQVVGNYIYGHDATNPIDRAMLLDNCNNFRLTGNTTWGGRLSAVRIDGASFLGVIDNNKFLSGATGAVGGDDAILLITGASQIIEVRDNVISGYGPAAGLVPINCVYCMAVGNGVFYGTLCQDIQVYNNIFATITAATGFPVAGDVYRSSTLAGTLYISPTLQRANSWGNQYFTNQRYFDVYADGDGGAAGGSAVISVPGHIGSLLGHQRILVTSTGDAVYVSAVGVADQITITNYDGATALTGGTLYFHIDG